VDRPLYRDAAGARQTAILQQGIYNPALVKTAEDCMRLEFQLDALGDEIILLAQRIPDEEGDFGVWAFDGNDFAFSNIYGRGGFSAGGLSHDVYVNGGIRIATGSNP